MREILFKGHHFTVSPEHGEAVMRVLLEALTQINEDWLRRYPGRFPLLYSAPVRYEREPAGQEEWKDIPTILEDGHGDCEDLACWRAAEARVIGGIDPLIARVDFTRRLISLPGASGPLTVFHILTRVGASLEDPSRVLGMGRPYPDYLAQWSGSQKAER